MKKRVSQNSLPEVGWREWVALTDLKIDKIKAKVDTGARTSALHAYDLKIYKHGKDRWVKFKVHPNQDDTTLTIEAKGKILEKRPVKSSTGHVQERIVIETNLKIGKEKFPIELTLTNRDMMGFRMLLGRQAIRNRFLVNPGKSFLSRGKSERLKK